MSAIVVERPRAFAAWFRDTLRWDVAFFQQVQWYWADELVRPAGNAILRRREEVDANVSRASLPIIEKISFGGEISVTAPDDRAGYKGRLFWAHPGDLIYSKIRVKQGSLAIVSNEIGDLAVSTEYPVYEVNAKIADPRYLALVFRSSSFKRLLEGLSHGGSTKTRIPPEEFERQLIPLPSLPMQQEVVAAWEAAQKSASAAAAKIERLEHDIEARFLADLGLRAAEKNSASPKAFALPWRALDRWSVVFNQQASTAVDLACSKYPVVHLGDVAAVSYGVQKSPANRPGKHARPYLRVANVQRGELDLREIKYIDVPDAELKSLRLKPGDVLFVEGNGSKAELGRCALWRGEIADCVHQNHILKVRPGEALLSEYMMTWFNTDVGKDHFFRSAKTSSGLGTINSSELRAAPIPLPPASTQRQITQRVVQARAEIAKLKREARTHADSAKSDLEAMILGSKPVCLKRERK